MQYYQHISRHQDCTFGKAEKWVLLHFESIDNQCVYLCQNHSDSTGKEKDVETGYGYFGARYLDQDMTTLFLSVDPMADKYPSLSPYAYCMWNPIKLVDPDGRDYGDYYDRSGKYLGWDGKNNNCVYIVGNYSDIIKIKENDKKGKTTSLNDLVSEPLLITTYGVLRESCNVLNRAEKIVNKQRKKVLLLIIIQGLGFVVKQEQPFTWIYQKLPIGYLLRFQFILIINIMMQQICQTIIKILGMRIFLEISFKMLLLAH